MLASLLPAIFALALAAHSNPIEQRAAPICNDNTAITVSATAPNLAIPASFNLSQTDSASGSEAFASQVFNAPTTTLTGTYTIRGRFCEPAVYNTSRHNTLQLLIRGIA